MERARETARIRHAARRRSDGAVATHTQRPAMPVIGFLHSGSAQQNAERLDAYRRGLKEAGFIEGQNVAVELRWAAGQNDRLPAVAADLIRVTW